MTALIVPFTRQPTVPIRPASTSLTRGIAFAFNPGAGFVDVTRQRLPNFAGLGGVSLKPAPRGTAFRSSANNSLGVAYSGSRLSTSLGNGTGAFTLLVIASAVASTTREFWYVCQNGSTEFYFGANLNVGLTATSGMVSGQTNSGGAAGVQAASMADGNPHVYVVRRDDFIQPGNVVSMFMDRDGARVASTTVVGNPAAQMWSSSSSDYLCGYNTGSWGISDSVALAVGWNRILSDKEVIEVSANPWSIFQSRRPRDSDIGGIVAATRPLFLPPSLTGLGSGGPFFGDRLAA